MLIRGDARHLPLADQCVQCVVTSPPYFGLRDYGHPQQLGLETTPDAYVAALVAVFQGVRRVLRDDGTLWLNIGDSYAGSGKGPSNDGSKQRTNAGSLIPGHRNPSQYMNGQAPTSWIPVPAGLKGKDLMGVPWRVAFALQADGWYLRSDIIWSKPNPMPESVTDRPTKAHEYLFLLSKNEHYYYDQDAIRTPYAEATMPRLDRGVSETHKNVNGAPGQTVHSLSAPRVHVKYRGQATKDYFGAGVQDPSETKRRVEESIVNGKGANARTVWTVPTMPYAGAHFATMPEALVEPCILAGCPLGGLVLDPFIGSGTVGAEAERLGRRWVGTDLSYQELAQDRTAQRGFQWAGSI